MKTLAQREGKRKKKKSLSAIPQLGGRPVDKSSRLLVLGASEKGDEIRTGFHLHRGVADQLFPDIGCPQIAFDRVETATTKHKQKERTEPDRGGGNLRTRTMIAQSADLLGEVKHFVQIPAHRRNMGAHSFRCLSRCTQSWTISSKRVRTCWYVATQLRTRGSQVLGT